MGVVNMFRSILFFYYKKSAQRNNRWAGVAIFVVESVFLGRSFRALDDDYEDHDRADAAEDDEADDEQQGDGDPSEDVGDGADRRDQQRSTRDHGEGEQVVVPAQLPVGLHGGQVVPDRVGGDERGDAEGQGHDHGIAEVVDARDGGQGESDGGEVAEPGVLEREDAGHG